MGHELTIAATGDTIPVAEGQTILDACLRAGVWLPHACCHGLCGTCKVAVADGEVDHGEASAFALMDSERMEGMALACCATLDSDVTIEAEIEDDPDALGIPVADFTGTVSALDTLTPTIRGITLALDRPMRFQPGQYVMVEIGGQAGMTRAFSIAAAGGGHTLELHVRRVPGGVGTAWLHEGLSLGDTVRLTGPYGRFFVRKSAAAPLLFVAGGSGLSSPRAMIQDLLAEGCTLPITLVYGARNRAELYGADEFEALAARHANFAYLPVLSDEPPGSDWTGLRGFAHEAAKAHFANDFRGHKAYLCGPPAMIEATIATLMQGRLFERDIYMEKFLSAADAGLARSPLFRRI